jgi:choline-glycine betaine transporter
MRRLLVVAFAGMLLSFSGTGLVYAQNPLDQACDTLEDQSVSTSCTPDGTKNPLTGADGLLAKIADVVAIIAGIAAVIMVLIGGFRYITANGDAQSATTARRTVLAAVIGLIVIVASWSIISFVLRRIS